MDYYIFYQFILTTLIAGGICEVTFATIRGHEVNEGFLVSSMLFALTLPASTPLWQVAWNCFWCCCWKRGFWWNWQELS